MEYLLSINFEQFVDELIFILGSYGFIIIIVFGIMHPLFENPLALLNLSLAFLLLGIPLGFLVVFLSNLVGILLLYLATTKFNTKSNDILFEKNISSKVLNWVNTTATWRHILVIGVPMIPTYPVKIAVPLSKVGFKKYMITLVGAYFFLYFGNSLIYFGVIGFLTNNLPSYVSFGLLLLFVVYIYFGRSFFKKNRIY